MDLAPGTVFAEDYRVERRLSSGGMGAVYIAQQISTGKRRALKLMHPTLVGDPASRQRFVQEARIGSLIASEHVVEVQNAGVDRATGLPFLAMELLEGEDLYARIGRGPVPPQEAYAILEQLSHALAAAHDAHVVHRDLKPENVYLAIPRSPGVSVAVRILDFGIAKITEDRAVTVAAGTPLWLAPEQTHKGVITPAADIWALGLLVFDMLVGRVFWRHGEGPNASVGLVVGEILNEPIPRASARAAEYGRTLPPGFDDWFARCVTRDPNARFPHARPAWSALAPILRAPSSLAQTQLAGSQASAFAQTQLPTAEAAFAQTQLPPAQFTQPSGFAPSHAHYTEPPKSSSAVGIIIALLVVLFLLIAGALGLFLYLRSQETEPEEVAMTTPTPAVSSTPPVASEQTDEEEDNTDDDDIPPSVLPPGMQFHQGTGHLGGMVMSEDEALQDSANKLFNGSLAPNLEACLEKSTQKSGGLTLIVKVNPDGTVSKVQSFAPAPGPSVQCCIDTLKATKFSPPKSHKTDIQFILTYH